MKVENEAFMFPSPAGPGQVISIDTDLCKGCNACVSVCRRHVIFPNTDKGKPPIVQFPQECWFCGYCVLFCPVPEAIKMVFPLAQRAGWKRKDTGEYFRIGMKNPPRPNTKPPVVWDVKDEKG